MNVSELAALNSGARAAASTSTGSSGNTAGNSPKNTLDGNAFITLLTAQLQAQDPLNPLDPNQMMNELVALNSLQQLIQIQQDLASLTGASSSSNSNAAVAPSTQTQSNRQPQNVAPSPSYHDAVVQRNLFPAQSLANL